MSDERGTREAKHCELHGNQLTCAKCVEVASDPDHPMRRNDAPAPLADQEMQRNFVEADAIARQLRAEVDMLRGVDCEADGDGPCGACLKCARASAIVEAAAFLETEMGDPLVMRARARGLRERFGIAPTRMGRNDATPQAYEKIATEMASLYPRGDETADELRVRLIGALGEVTTLRQEAADRRSRSEARLPDRPPGGPRPPTQKEVMQRVIEEHAKCVGEDDLGVMMRVGDIDPCATREWLKQPERDRSKAHPQERPIEAGDRVKWRGLDHVGTVVVVKTVALVDWGTTRREQDVVDLRRPDAPAGGDK